MSDIRLTGYGPSNQWQSLIFDGDERKFELWETKILGYLKVKGFKEIFSGEEVPDEGKNELAFAELIQFLDQRSLALVMRDAREALKILRAHYEESGKHSGNIMLCNQLTTLRKKSIRKYYMF